MTQLSGRCANICGNDEIPVFRPNMQPGICSSSSHLISKQFNLFSCICGTLLVFRDLANVTLSSPTVTYRVSVCLSLAQPAQVKQSVGVAVMHQLHFPLNRQSITLKTNVHPVPVTVSTPLHSILVFQCVHLTKGFAL